MREVTLERNTNETQIELTLNLDGAGRYDGLGQRSWGLQGFCA